MNVPNKCDSFHLNACWLNAVCIVFVSSSTFVTKGKCYVTLRQVELKYDVELRCYAMYCHGMS